MMWGGCMSSCNQPTPCDNPQLWYSPASDLEVHFGCEPPGPDWRKEPFIAEIGVDLDGSLRGLRGPKPTADTGLGELGPLGPLPAVDEGPPDTAVPFGPTADTWDTGAPYLTGDTGGGGFVGPRQGAPDEATRSDDAEGSEEPEDDTGLFADTGLVEDTFDTSATGDTGQLPVPTGDTGPFPLAPTADTGVIE